MSGLLWFLAGLVTGFLLAVAVAMAIAWEANREPDR